MRKIPVIDLFAGPGGLGEGFSSVLDENGERVFEIKLSIEKDVHAHKTLRLRSFYRQFGLNEVPSIYYDYISENAPIKQEKILDRIKKDYAEEWNRAENEAWNYELPYKLEVDKNGRQKGGYSDAEIQERNKEIDGRINIALKGHDEFVLIGGPPCQAYSLVGRSRNKGISESDHRVRLYKEYLRIIAKHHPVVFVMENVKGLLSAEVGEKKVFDLIKSDLTDPNTVFKGFDSPKYKIFSLVKAPDSLDDKGFPVYGNNRDYLIKAEKYGVPQRRHRVILLGIRDDLQFDNLNPLVEKDEEVKLKQVIGSLPPLRSGIGRKISGKKENGKHKYTSIENNHTNWIEAVEDYLEKMDDSLKKQFQGFINTDNQGMNYQEVILKETGNPLYTWFKDEKLKGVLNHESRTHLKEDLGRYLFSSLHMLNDNKFPRLKDYPQWLKPLHKNESSGKFADRFRTQNPENAATTVTSHISKDGHYFIHYDPSQCRSLTVREAARIQTFPDNYYFCGSRTHQYHQVGNAVPPYLAWQIGEVVYDIIIRTKKV